MRQDHPHVIQVAPGLYLRQQLDTYCAVGFNLAASWTAEQARLVALELPRCAGWLPTPIPAEIAAANERISTLRRIMRGHAS